MASSAQKICCVCKKMYYLKERKPLSLPCGHTFCTYWLLEIQSRNDKLCPKCRLNRHGQTSDKLPFVQHLADTFTKIKIPSAGRQKNCDHAGDVIAWCDDCKVSSCTKCLQTDHRQCSWVSIKKKTKKLVGKLKASVTSTEMMMVKNDSMLSEISDHIKQLHHYEKKLQSFAKKLSVRQDSTKSKLEKFAETRYEMGATEYTKTISATMSLLDDPITVPKIPKFVVPLCEEPEAAADFENELDGSKYLDRYLCFLESPEIQDAAISQVSRLP